MNVCFFNGDFSHICENVYVCTQFACISVYIYPENFSGPFYIGEKKADAVTVIILNILLWEKIILCGRPKWTCVPVKSDFSPQNRPEVIHRPFVRLWCRDKAFKELDDSSLPSVLASLLLTGIISLSLFVLIVFSHLLPLDLDKKCVCITACWCECSAHVHVYSS